MPNIFSFNVSERNTSNSRLVISPPEQEGVQSRLQAEPLKPVFNQKDIDTLRSESALNRLGKIEQLAVAEKLVEEKMNVYSKSGFATQFAKYVQQSKSSKK